MAIRALVSIYNEHSSSWVHFDGATTSDIPVPSDYSGLSSTVVDSGRNISGQVIGGIVREDVAKVELKWNFMTVAQYAKLAQLFDSKYNGNFFVGVSFFDIVAGTWDGSIESAPDIVNNPIRLFYPSDRKVQFAKMVLNSDGSPKGYENVSLNLIDTGFLVGQERS